MIGWLRRWWKGRGGLVTQPTLGDCYDPQAEEFRHHEARLDAEIDKHWAERKADPCLATCKKCGFSPRSPNAPQSPIHGCRYNPTKDLLTITCHRCKYRWAAPPQDRSEAGPCLSQ